MFKSIVVAVDGSDPSNRALRTAATLAAQMTAKLDLVYVVDSNHLEIPEDLRRMTEVEHIANPLPATPYSLADAPANLFRSMNENWAAIQRTSYELAEYIVKQAKKDAGELGAEEIETSIEIGNPADRIVALAKRKNADLIVVGRRGFGQLKSLLMGSTSHKVSLLAECSCLTVN